jgi:hypothetical protein
MDSPITIRAMTGNRNPLPLALHWMASGVVDQMSIIDKYAAGTDMMAIPWIGSLKTKKATELSLWPFGIFYLTT